MDELAAGAPFGGSGDGGERGIILQKRVGDNISHVSDTALSAFNGED